MDEAVEGEARPEACHDEDGDDGHYGDEDEGHGGIEEDGHHDAADGEERSLDEDPHEAVGEILHLGHVVREPRHERGLFETVELHEVEAVDAPVEVAAKDGAEALRDPARDEVAHGGPEGPERRDRQHGEPEREHDGEIARRHPPVYDPRHYRRLHEVAGRLEGEEGEGRREGAGVGFDIGNQEATGTILHGAGQCTGLPRLEQDRSRPSYSHLKRAAAAARKTRVIAASTPRSPAIFANPAPSSMTAREASM